MVVRPVRDEALPAFHKHCPAIYETIIGILPNASAPLLPSCNHSHPDFPFLLHSVGRLHPLSQNRTQQVIETKSEWCQRHSPPPPPRAPTIAGLSNGTTLPLGYTHAFLVDDGSCERSRSILQATMTAPDSRVRVRLTPLADGLYLVFFHPADPGDYLVEVFHHYPLPKPNQANTSLSPCCVRV
eukprot:EG_transcript_32459